MNHIKNEQGLIVIAEGSEGSPIRMKCKYPVSLAIQITKYEEQVAKGANPVIAFEGDFEDNNHFIRAVKFYADQEKLLK